MADRSLIAIVTPAFGSPESVAALKDEAADGNGGGFDEVRLIVPAVEINPLHHTLGDIDEPREKAKARLEEALAAARAGGVPIASAEVGDPDPVQAAQDAILVKPADEVLIFAHDDAHDWYEGDLWKHAEDSLEPPLKLVVLDGGPESKENVVDTEFSGAGQSNTDADSEVSNAYIPDLTRGDTAVMVLGVIGTIVAIVLAAVATANGSATGWPALAIGIAIAIALVNMANVVGTLLMESVRYRGGFAWLLRTTALIGTPVAVIVNLIIALTS
jgi:hypothetical protein